jgi:hypothetical protein
VTRSGRSDRTAPLRNHRLDPHRARDADPDHAVVQDLVVEEEPVPARLRRAAGLAAEQRNAGQVAMERVEQLALRRGERVGKRQNRARLGAAFHGADADPPRQASFVAEKLRPVLQRHEERRQRHAGQGAGEQRNAGLALDLVAVAQHAFGGTAEQHARPERFADLPRDLAGVVGVVPGKEHERQIRRGRRRPPVPDPIHGFRNGARRVGPAAGSGCEKHAAANSPALSSCPREPIPAFPAGRGATPALRYNGPGCSTPARARREAAPAARPRRPGRPTRRRRPGRLRRRWSFKRRAWPACRAYGAGRSTWRRAR